MARNVYQIFAPFVGSYIFVDNNSKPLNITEMGKLNLDDFKKKMSTPSGELSAAIGGQTIQQIQQRTTTDRCHPRAL